MNFTLTSPAFVEDGEIPQKYSCEGEDISPALVWGEPPSGTKSFVLICDDHDVPKNLRPDGVWDHWVVFNIPASVRGFPEAMKDLPSGTCLGKNGWGGLDYRGPCPPDREHRYEFKIYALDTTLDIPEGPSKTQVEESMKGHILAQTTLMGRYDKEARRKG